MSKLTSQQLQELYEGMDGQLRQQIYSWFKSLDKDNSGYLDPAEFYAARTAMQLEDEIQTEEQLRAYINKFDADNNGQLDLYEFCYVLIDLMGGAVSAPTHPIEDAPEKVEEPEKEPAEAATFDIKRPNDEEEAAAVPATMDEPAPESGFDDDADAPQEPQGAPATMDEPEGIPVTLEEPEPEPEKKEEPKDDGFDEPEFDM